MTSTPLERKLETYASISGNNAYKRRDAVPKEILYKGSEPVSTDMPLMSYWALAILHRLHAGSGTFTEIQKALPEQVERNVLVKFMQNLEAAGLVRVEWGSAGAVYKTADLREFRVENAPAKAPAAKK